MAGSAREPKKQESAPVLVELARGFRKVVGGFLASIDKLPPRTRVPLIALLLVGVVSMMMILRGQPEQYAINVVIVCIMAALVAPLLGGRWGFSGALVILVFGALALYDAGTGRISATTPMDSMAVKDPITVAEPLPPRDSLREMVSIAGNIYRDRPLQAIAEALVCVTGHKEKAITDERGFFELQIPKYIVRRDSFTVNVQAGSSRQLFPRTLEDRPLLLYFTEALQPAVALGISGNVPRLGFRSSAAEVAIRWAGASREVGRDMAPARREGLRVILDSIITRRSAPSNWHFSIDVNGKEQMRVVEAKYTDKAPDNIMLVGGEAHVSPPMRTARIYVRGSGKVARSPQGATGAAYLPFLQLMPDRPTPIRVSVSGDAEFTFYFTLIKLSRYVDAYAVQSRVRTLN